MADLLSFEVVVPDENGEQKNIVIFFSGPSMISAPQVSDALQEGLANYVLPDHVVFLLAEIYSDDIRSECRIKNSPISVALQRKPLKNSPTYGFAFYDMYGRIVKYFSVTKKVGYVAKRILQNQAEILKSGLKKIVDETDVVLKAPAGYLYHKPSSRSSNYFIRGENSISEALNAHLMAFSALFLFKEVDGKSVKIDTIYLDTMALLPIALSIQAFRKLFGDSLPLRIESFHSHEGLKKGSLPYAKSAICLISASSSCGLAKEWCHVNKVSATKVLIFFSFAGDSEYCVVRYKLDSPSDYKSVGEIDGFQNYKMIRMQGERFVAEHSEAKTLNIGADHAPAELQSHFNDFVGGNIFQCFKNEDHPEKYRTVYVNKADFVRSKNFLGWFDTCLNEMIPASTTHVIFDDDLASSGLADICLRFLSARGVNQCQKIRMNEFDETHFVSGSVVVIAVAAERGSKLLHVSRLLRRTQCKGTRLYILGALLGISERQINELCSNLSQPAKGCRRYSVQVFMKAPVANHLCTKHWADELSILSKISTFSDEDSCPAIEARIKAIREDAPGLPCNAFWPSSYTGSAMMLRRGFAFVDDKGNVTTASGSDVYLAISWVLQNARESQKIEDEKRLSSGEVQQVLLSPEVFSRYDDGVIQAAFLRAALPTELDYSSHESHSRSMANIIKRAAAGYGIERGEAAMEFVIALAIGKIQLAPNILLDLKGCLVSGLREKMPGIHLLFESDNFL